MPIVVAPDPNEPFDPVTPPSARVVPAPDPNEPLDLPGYVPPGLAPGETVIPAPELAAARLGRVAGSAAVRGAAEGVGLPGDLAQLAAAVAPQSVADVLSYVPTSRQTLAVTEKALPSIVAPQNLPGGAGEKILAGGAEAIGSSLPFALVGGVPALVRGGTAAIPEVANILARGTLEAGGMGAGGAAGEEYGGPLAAIPAAIGGLALGRGVGNLGGRIFGSAGRGEILNAYDALGVTPRLVGDVAPDEAPIASWVQRQMMGRRGFGAGPEAARETVGELGPAVTRIADDLHPAASTQQAGTALQNDARNWLTKWRTDQNTAETGLTNRVKTATTVDAGGNTVPADTSVSLTPVNAALSSATSQMPGLPDVARVMTRPVFRDIQDALSKNAPGGALSWEDARGLRTRVGEELTQSLLARDGTDQAWRQLYGALSQSLGDTATRVGFGDEWGKVNQIGANGHRFVEDVVNNIISSPGAAGERINPEDAANWALGARYRRGGSVLGDIRDNLGEGSDALAANYLRGAAQPAVGQSVTTPRQLQAALDPRRLSPEAREALFPAGTASGDKLKALDTVLEHMDPKTVKYGTLPEVPHDKHGLATLLLGSELGIEHLFPQAGEYAWPAAAATAGLYGGGQAASRLTAAPWLTRYLARPGGGASAVEMLAPRTGAAVGLAHYLTGTDVPREPSR